MTGDRTPAGAGATPEATGSASASLYERYKDALRRGHVAALRGRHEAAIDAYGEAAGIAPDRALPHTSIGAILLKMDRPADALRAYERALALAPRDEAALRGLAEVHQRAGRRTLAAERLDRLAEILDAAGRLADATDAARRALELAESRARRSQVEALAGRLRAVPGDEAAQRALGDALRLLEPADTSSERGTGRRASEEAPGQAEPSASAAAEPEPDAEAEPEAAHEAEAAPEPEAASEPELQAEPVPEPEPEPEPVEPAGLGIALGAVAEAALFAGDVRSAHEGLLAAARAHRRAGRHAAAIDACYLAIGIAPSDPELHLLLVEIYLDRGWRSQAADKLLLLGRLADLDDDQAVRDRLCAIVAARLADEPRVSGLCA